MGLLPLLKKQLTPTKLLFHFLFWTFHWGIFAYGWYASLVLVKLVRRMAKMADMMGVLGGSKRRMSAWRASTRWSTRCGSHEVLVWF